MQPDMQKAVLLLLCMLATLVAGQPDIEEIIAIVPEVTALPSFDDPVAIHSDTVRYFQHILSVLETKETKDLMDELREEYNILNSDGTLGPALHALFELRLEDMLTSIKQYEKLKTVLDTLTQSNYISD